MQRVPWFKTIYFDNVVQYFNTVFGSPAKEKVDNVKPIYFQQCENSLWNIWTHIQKKVQTLLKVLSGTYQYCYLHDRPYSRSF